MPTAKKIINLSVDDSLYAELEELQNLRGVPSLSSIVIELTKEAWELQEDLYFARLAEGRENEKEVSHKEIWKWVGRSLTKSLLKKISKKYPKTFNT